MRRRAEGQRADALWVLSVHETDAEAALREALVAHQWRIPTWQFRSVNEAVPLGQFWSKAGNNVANARGCLAAHGRQLAHPFWQRGDGWENTRRPVAMRACNLLSGMLVLEPDEVTPGPKGELWAHDGANGWAPAAVNRSHYDGPVYNLDVADDHTYVADGIATHNCYLKLWQLSDPRLACDYVLFDEAQDANPVVAAVVDRQAHAQRILVGDSCQAIYGWRGAIDALARFPAEERLVLSQSFRFGPAIATEANRWLALLDAPLRLRGSTRLPSRVGPLSRADAVLCRTNAEAVRQVLLGVDQARRVALVGGGEPIRRLAQAAISLKAGRGTDHPELFAFTTWAEVQDYAANDHAGADLKVLVDLIDGHGPEQLVYLVDQLVGEPGADLVVSTAHKAKGREWPSVRLAGDFAGPDQRGDGRPAEVPRAEAMLAYVAVTRARHALDPAGLAPTDQPQPAERPGRWWA